MTDYMSPLLPLIEMIENEDIRNLLTGFMRNEVPAYFWTTGASASGKYHPAFAKGEGGLVRHTVAVVKIALELFNLECMRDTDGWFNKDEVIVAAMVHDTFKYGITGPEDSEGKRLFHLHGELAANMFEGYALRHGFAVGEKTLRAIKCHMGQWSAAEVNRNPGENELARIVHVADYIASRNFIDLPEFWEEGE